MNPKKFKNILEEIIKDIDCDKQLVSDVMDFYWTNVRKSIVTVAHPRINIESLGAFRVKSTILQKTITKYKVTMHGFKNPDFAKYPRYQSLKDRLEILEKAAVQLKSEIDRHRHLKTTRYADTIRGLEEEGQDT